MVILKKRDGIFWLQFSALLKTKGLWHGIFTRSGGVSRDPFASLNVGMGNGDANQHVMNNRRRIADLLPEPTVYTIHQTHGTKVVHIHSTAGSNALSPPDGDAVITSAKGCFLMIQVADCQAVLLADPIRKVVANVHSGWRGSCSNIIRNTVASLLDDYHCRPEHIIAAVGPSLGPCCAEFKHYRREIPSQLWSYKDHRDYFNFWAISRDQLTAAGLNEKNIHLSQICTRCNPHLFFSYRAQKTPTGRFAAVIGLV